MAILRIQVQNFQSLSSVTLDVEGLTCVVGPSNRGKSALVRALSAALFNLPGEHFVREGTETATVELILSNRGDQHTVRWDKGGGKNQFRVDGTLFAKVGRETPKELQALGFREEVIGARIKEDGGTEGGTAIRPQVAEQFDGPYLLKQSGTFIGEVVTKLSRLGVLQRATRECALDKTADTRLLKLRREDYEDAKRTAERLAPVPLLRERLNVLVTLDEELEEKRRLKTQIQHYLGLRSQAQVRLAVALPVVAADRTARAAQLLADYQKVLAVRAHLERRAKLSTLPKTVTAYAASDGAAYAALLSLKEKRDRLAQLIGARVMRQTAVASAEHACQQAEARYAAALQAVETFKQETPVCPLCTQPWAGAHAHEMASV